MIWWIVLGIGLFVLFCLGRLNLEVYRDSGSGYRGWCPLRMSLGFWILAGLIAFIPILNLVSFILWLTIFGAKISCCIPDNYGPALGSIRTTPGKWNWVYTLVEFLSREY